MFRSHRYRVANEQVVLNFTILLVLGVIVLLSSVTFCLSGVFILGMFILSAILIRSHHQSLIQTAQPVNAVETPGVSEVVAQCQAKLQPGPVDVYLVNEKQMNAYTFGISTPKALVVYTPLVQVMSPDELAFIVGHEMGHVALGHTWLNTIVGGLAGIPAPFGAAVLLYAAFRWWNRMCEFSADRAGLLACGELRYAIAAMVKLVAPEVRSQQEFERALALIDAEDEVVSNRLAEAFQSHPMLIRRINQLRAYAGTEEYRRLQAGMDQNVSKPQPIEAMLTQRDDVPPQPPVEPQLPPEERWPWLKPKD